MTCKTTLRAATAVLSLLAAGSARAADLPMAAPAPVPEVCKAVITTPTYGGPIKQNPNPSCYTSPIGDLYLGGALTGYLYRNVNPFNPLSPVAAVPLNTAPDADSRVDFTNAHLHLQKADGAFQFFVLAGLYSIPTLGLPVYTATDQNTLLFGPVPVAYGKYQFNDEWSIQGGRMFTNIGTELLFTYQNINISRGLLFNQENFINQGVQVNYSSGPVSASVAVTDGFYSGALNWVTGFLTYKLDDNNTVGVNGGSSFARFDPRERGSQFQYATPLNLQNSRIASVNYTYTNGALTLTPYLQYTNVEADARLGIVGGAETFGAALLGFYAFTDNFALGGRFEYIAQTGNRLFSALTGFQTTNLLYGPGSEAFSYTVTPTFTFDRFFVRGEYSHVSLRGIQFGDATGLITGTATLGTGFGTSGNKRNQDRYMIEAGFTF